jgi:D-serine deaminase-like pyridoxal phosphate-dependent protein
VSEAEVMAASGIRDILIANQIVTPQKMMRLAQLQKQANVKVCVDNVENAHALGAVATGAGVEIGVLIEVDTGMLRSGVLPGQPSLQLAQLVHDVPGLALRGAMTWEGHTLTHDAEADKRAAIEQSVGQLVETVELCRAHDLPMDIVSAGGSATYQVTPFIKGVTEVQAGGAIWCDATYQRWGVQLEPALFVRAAVTSRPVPTRIILDAGFKTLARGFESPRVVGIAGPHSVVLSAEHGIVTLDQPDTTSNIGDGVDLLVSYSDATMFAHDKLYGVREGVVEAAWDVLGRGKLQ